MKDILFIDKPKGITSFDVIRILRKKLGIRKMGHSGTLDPLATGLLIIGVGEGTKKLKKFQAMTKVYLMDVILGKKTETGDLDGKVIEEKKVEGIDIKKIKKILEEMTGRIEFEVPLYSAIKIKGKPLYKLARKGETAVLPRRNKRIFYLRVKDCFREENSFILRIEMKCESGTYARAIAQIIGEKMSLPSVIKDLRRIKIGNHSVKKAKPFTFLL